MKIRHQLITKDGVQEVFPHKESECRGIVTTSITGYEVVFGCQFCNGRFVYSGNYSWNQDCVVVITTVTGEK